VNWGKGEAVRWILDRHHASPEQAICIGDDETDEDMFRRVPTAVNVRIMKPRVSMSAARYCLSRNEVPAFLEGLIDVIQGLCMSQQYPM
jgi:trehalose-phosphatase